MGMREKLLRAYIQGCNDTWDLVEEAIKEVPGIGPKTHAKMMDAIKQMAAREVEAVNNLRPAERKKLFSTIEKMGTKGEVNHGQ